MRVPAPHVPVWICLVFPCLAQSHNATVDTLTSNASSCSTEAIALKYLFDRYGDVEHMTMTLEGFMHLVCNIGLRNLSELDNITCSELESHTDTSHRHVRSIDGRQLTSLPTTPAKIQCLSASEMFTTVEVQNESLSKSSFIQLCPVLIQQLDSRQCQRSLQAQGQTSRGFIDIPSSVWLHSSVAVLIISLVGVATVALIPLTRKTYYNHLSQVLVALAVGSLTGDSCLHLIPHALTPTVHEDSSDDSHSSHSASVFKGLVILLGIYFFFLVERLMAILTAHRRKQRQASQKQESENNIKLDQSGEKSTSCRAALMVVHANKDVKDFVEDAHQDVHQDCGSDSFTSIRGHSHGHSHHRPQPGSVAAVAWMVIMGDGLHNFSDGMAIGAAFASSLSGGISTSVAVFCHELPHELGDFAMLLRAGMSVRQALLYNCLSSFLCLIGMVVGVSLGNMQQASLWIFALIGGLFLYIALVDMLPEMMSVDPKLGENPFLHLCLQMLGMFLGAGIMLLIAIFEHKINFY